MSSSSSSSSSASPASSMVAQDIINQVLMLLGQAQNVELGGLPTGYSSSYAVTPVEGMLDIINKGMNEVVKYTVPIRDTYSTTLTSGGVLSPTYQLLSVNNRPLRTPISVTINGYKLTPAKSGQMEDWYSYYDPLTGSPAGWTDERSQIILSMPITTSSSCSIVAYCYPVQLASVSDEVDPYIDDEVVKLVTYYAAAQVVFRGITIPDLAQRAQIWQQLYLSMLKTRYQSLLATDRTLGAYFPEVPGLQDLPIVPQKKESSQ